MPSLGQPYVTNMLITMWITVESSGLNRAAYAVSFGVEERGEEGAAKPGSPPFFSS